MPIMPSTQVYMPDPLTGPRAATAGFNIGKESSPFANFVSGAFQGAKDTVAIADTLQQMEFRPIEQARADKEQQAMEAYRIRNNEQQDERLAFDKYKQQQDYDLQKQQESRLRMSASIAQGNQARSTMVTGMAAEYITSGDSAPINALWGSNDTRTKGEFLKQVNADPDLASQMLYKAQEEVLAGKASPAMTQFAEALEHSYTLNKTAGQVKDAETQLMQTVGVVPDAGYKLGLEPARDADKKLIDGMMDVYQVRQDGTAGKRIGRVPVTGDPKTDGNLYRAQAIFNNGRDKEESVRQAILNKSINKAAERNQNIPPPQDEVPVNTSVANTKLGNTNRAADKYAPGRQAGPSNVQLNPAEVPAMVDKESKKSNPTDPKRQAAKDKLSKIKDPNFVSEADKNKQSLLTARPFGY